MHIVLEWNLRCQNVSWQISDNPKHDLMFSLHNRFKPQPIGLQVLQELTCSAYIECFPYRLLGTAPVYDSSSLHCHESPVWVQLVQPLPFSLRHNSDTQSSVSQQKLLTTQSWTASIPVCRISWIIPMKRLQRPRLGLFLRWLIVGLHYSGSQDSKYTLAEAQTAYLWGGGQPWSIRHSSHLSPCSQQICPHVLMS